MFGYSVYLKIVAFKAFEHDNKFLFSRSERSERRVNNCLSRLRGTALSAMAVLARLT